MITRYDPVQNLPMGNRTLGVMEPRKDGDWVNHAVHAKLCEELVSALVAAKSWMQEEADLESMHPHDRAVYVKTMEKINNAIKKATE